MTPRATRLSNFATLFVGAASVTCSSPLPEVAGPSSSEEGSESTTLDTTGTTTEGVDTTATEEGSTTTTGGPTCTHDQCFDLDPARPICGDDGMCVACNGAGGDMACAEAHTGLPVCLTEGSDIGRCVQCTESATAECTGLTPICNGANYTCEPCIVHAQCMETIGSACHIETGECLPADRVWNVDEGETIAAALMNVGVGERGTIVLHGAGVYGEVVSIDEGRVVAIVAPGTERPQIALDAANGLVVVSGADTVAYLEGLTITLNGSGPGLRVDEEAHAHVDRCEIINNNIGIELTNGAVLDLRNSIAWTSQANLTALSVDGSTAIVSYSTLAHTGGGFQTYDAIQCNNPMSVALRNSVIVSSDADPNGWNCEGMGVSISNSAGENIPPDSGNVLLCEGDVDCTMEDIVLQLFMTGTNLRLDPAGAAILANVPLFDPLTDLPYDIDLNPRPSRAGTDYAGAHAPP